MSKIHSLAIVDPSAKIADSVSVGPFAHIGAGVVLGEDCIVESHASVLSGTVLGARNVVGQSAVLGGDPQDRKYKGEETYLIIGDDNVFREFVTIHRGSGPGTSTKIGNHCYIMGYCHIGHNCTVEDEVTIANYSGVSGHATLEHLVNIGGMTGVHQYARVGKVAMVGGMSRIVQDAPPFMITEGNEQTVHDINAVGLRRIGVTSERRMALHRACKLLYKSQLGLRNAIEVVEQEVPLTEEVTYLLQFAARRFQGKNGRGDQP